MNVAPLVPPTKITGIPATVCAPADVPSGLTVNVVVPDVSPVTTKLSVKELSSPKSGSVPFV